MWGDCKVYEYTFTGAGSSTHPASSVQKVILGELTVNTTTSEKYSLTVKKVDATNPTKGLAGAQFHIQSENGAFSKDVVTGADGTYTLTDLDANTYAVTETAPPPGGYKIDNAGPQYVVLPSNGNNTVTVTFTDSTETTGEGSIRKVDADNPSKGLAGAVIKITGVDNSFVGTYTTGEGGYITDIPWDTLPIGSFVAEEVTPPEGYTKSPDQSKVKQTFVWDGKTDVSLVFENDSKVKIQLMKLDDSNNPLPGCVFNIVKDGQIIGTEATKEDGSITVTDVTEGMYAFVEVSAPAPYSKLTEPVFAHVDQATINGGGTVTVTASDKKLPNLTILKRDAKTGDVIPNTNTSVPTGFNGAAIGSGDYIQRIEHNVFLSDLSMAYSARFGSPSYTSLLRDSLGTIAHTLESDLSRNERENNYITDEMAPVLKRAGQDLSHCGIIISIDSAVDKLAWFVGGDPAKIRKLQSKLNEMHIGEHLTEDGVYGKKTEQAVAELFDQLFHGSIHTLAWINPLQSSSTGITSEPIIKNGETIFSLRDSSARSVSGKPIVVFRPDTPHNGFPYTHINAVEGRSLKNGQYIPSSERQLANLNAMNHTEISEDAYRLLKDFDGTCKKVRTAGRVLLVAGLALEALELYQTIESDLHDADRKIGKKTYSHVASIVGSWALSALGSKGGAWIGATIGTAIMPGVGTAIGGAVGGVTLGLVGSFGGSAIGKCVVDISATE